MTVFEWIVVMIGVENEGDGEPGVDGEKKKRQTRGGRGVVKVKQKQDVEKHICLSRACRGKRKFVTVITGLATYGEIPGGLYVLILGLWCPVYKQFVISS